MKLARKKNDTQGRAPFAGGRPESPHKMKMTIYEFKLFAERCVSEDVTRPKLQQPCRDTRRTYVSDGRIALIIEASDPSFKTFSETGTESVVNQLTNRINSFNAALERGDDACEKFRIDAARLRTAAHATFCDLEPSMDYLRHYEPDPDDLDDVATTETVRFVYQRYAFVILNDRLRTVIAGYYADILADVLAATDTRYAYIYQTHADSAIYVKGENWYLILMPLRGKPEFGEAHWMVAGAIADAATGELLHSYENNDEIPRADMDVLRWQQKGGAK